MGSSLLLFQGSGGGGGTFLLLFYIVWVGDVVVCLCCFVLLFWETRFHLILFIYWIFIFDATFLPLTKQEQKTYFCMETSGIVSAVVKLNLIYQYLRHYLFAVTFSSIDWKCLRTFKSSSHTIHFSEVYALVLMVSKKVTGSCVTIIIIII